MKKHAVLQQCMEAVCDRIDSLRHQLHDLVEGAKNDSKSTAGDKHETARAMMQIEQEKLSNQLNLLLEQQKVLEKIMEVATTDYIGLGSLVKTNHGFLFISIPLGKVNVGGESVMCLSAKSPLGKLMIGKKAGENVVINNQEYRIDELN